MKKIAAVLLLSLALAGSAKAQSFCGLLQPGQFCGNQTGVQGTPQPGTGSQIINAGGGTLSLSPASGTTNQAILITQTGPAANSASGPISYNDLEVSIQSGSTATGSAGGTGNSNVSALRVNAYVGSTAMFGNWTGAIFGHIREVNFSGGGHAGDVTGVSGYAYSNSGGSQGILNGVNSGAFVDTGSGRSVVESFEADVGVTSGVAVTYRVGVGIWSFFGTQQGSTLDAAIAVTALNAPAGGGTGPNVTGAPFGTIMALSKGLAGSDPVNTSTNFFSSDTAYTIANWANLGNITVSGNILNFVNAQLSGAGVLTLTDNVNNGIAQTFTNNSAGTSAAAEWEVSNGTNNATFGIAGVNFTNALYQGRAFLTANGTGLVVGSTVASPTVFIVGNAEVGRWDGSTAGQFDLGVAGTTVGKVSLNNATSGSITLAPPTGALGSAVLTLPDVTDTLTANAATQTLTNKTLASSTDVLGGVTMTMGSDATGDIYYRNLSGILTRLGVGSGSQVIGVSAGLPAWAQLSTSSLSDTTVCTSYIPTDQSGGSIGSFTSVSVNYCKYGNLVYVYGTLTYPSTADTNHATISLPVAVPNQNYAANACGFTEESGVQDVYICPIKNTSTAQFFVSSSGSNKTNANLSLKIMSFSFDYPAS